MERQDLGLARSAKKDFGEVRSDLEKQDLLSTFGEERPDKTCLAPSAKKGLCQVIWKDRTCEAPSANKSLVEAAEGTWHNVKNGLKWANGVFTADCFSRPW